LDSTSSRYQAGRIFDEEQQVRSGVNRSKLGPPATRAPLPTRKDTIGSEAGEIAGKDKVDNQLEVKAEKK
jgi:hypothetical protein